MRFMAENKKTWNADYDNVAIELLNVSPPIGSKVRKLKNAGNSYQYNKDIIPEMGFDIENPGMYAVANVVSALTNVPLDRLVTKINNLKGAFDVENETWQRIAMAMGYNRWDLGMGKPEDIIEAKETVKERKKKDKQVQVDIEDQVEVKDNIELQKKEREEGKDKIKCAAISRSGNRCGKIVKGGGNFCTIHEKKEQRADGTKVKCKGTRTNGSPCGMTTSNKSGYCYYHD